MPVYEFKCKKCDAQFEELMRMNDSKKPICPECGAKQTERLLSLFSSGASGTGSGCGHSHSGST